MFESYIPLLILLGISAAQAVGMVVLSEVVSPTKKTAVKSSPYESGIDPLGSTRERFSVKFYVVAILFIVFDVETVFLVPWAVVMVLARIELVAIDAVAKVAPAQEIDLLHCGDEVPGCFR